MAIIVAATCSSVIRPAVIRRFVAAITRSFSPPLWQLLAAICLAKCQRNPYSRPKNVGRGHSFDCRRNGSPSYGPAARTCTNPAVA